MKYNSLFPLDFSSSFPTHHKLARLRGFIDESLNHCHRNTREIIISRALPHLHVCIYYQRTICSKSNFIVIYLNATADGDNLIFDYPERLV